METPIGNDGGRARCAAFKTRNIRRISVGFRHDEAFMDKGGAMNKKNRSQP